MNQIVWVKPSGIEVITNDFPVTIAAAQALGWKQKKEPKNDQQANDDPKKDK